MEVTKHSIEKYLIEIFCLEEAQKDLQKHPLRHAALGGIDVKHDIVLSQDQVIVDRMYESPMTLPVNRRQT
ncbi:hypothetical protein D3C74_199030 [compost metagenome]